MNSEIAGKIIGLLWNDILIANWFNKEWVEQEFKVKLTESQYQDIVDEYNNSGIPDHITQDISEWFTDNDIIEGVLE